MQESIISVNRLSFLGCLVLWLATGAWAADSDALRAARAHWYNEAKFGLFVHWGSYSVLHRSGQNQLAEWVQSNEKIDIKEYEKLANSFAAENYSPDEWVTLARQTGSRYIVLTSKHHEGFALFNTKLSDYNAVKTAAKRDLVGDLIIACRKQNIHPCFYFSFMDWHHPDYVGELPFHKKSNPNHDKFIGFMHGQVREICTNYGPIDGLWFDGEWDYPRDFWKAAELVKVVRELQPLAFVNDRLGKDERGKAPEADFFTAEQEVPESGFDHAWETCDTFGHSWGYTTSHDPLKSPELIIRRMVDVFSKGGNYLLNVGPTPDGRIPQMFVDRMKVIGQWMQQNGEAVYGTHRSPLGKLSYGKATTKGNRLYVFLEERKQDAVELPPLNSKILKAWVLSTGQLLNAAQDDKGVKIEVPQKFVDVGATVLAVELEAAPKVK
ncbi:MAG: alpha-L-fucosidase [Verrucomicrobiota bacterium]